MFVFKHLLSPVIPQERCCDPHSLWADAEPPEDGAAVSVVQWALGQSCVNI